MVGGDNLKLSPCCPQKLTHKTWTSPLFKGEDDLQSTSMIGVPTRYRWGSIKKARDLEWKVSVLSPTDSVLVALSFYGPLNGKGWYFIATVGFIEGMPRMPCQLYLCIVCGLPKLCNSGYVIYAFLWMEPNPVNIHYSHWYSVLAGRARYMIT